VSLKNPEQVESGAEPLFELVVSHKNNPSLSALISPQETREHLELCPEAFKIMNHISERLEEDGGAAVVVDYGHSGEKTDTFRVSINYSAKRKCLQTRRLFCDRVQSTFSAVTQKARKRELNLV